MLVEQRFVAYRARGDDAHHLAFHRPLAGSRVADLFADHHRFAQLHQAAEIAFGRMKRNSGHGNRIPTGLAAGGKGDIQQFGGLLGVLVEQLVEVPHAVEHQLVRMLALEPPVLLHHWRMFGEVLSVFGHEAGVIRRGGSPGSGGGKERKVSMQPEHLAGG